MTTTEATKITGAVVAAAKKACVFFMSQAQFETMEKYCKGEEADYFKEAFITMAATINTMAKTYEQDGKGDAAVVYLHYFVGGCDWYITEKDVSGGAQEQAFGYANLGYGGELGYISIAEVVAAGAELDLFWKAGTTLGEVQAKETMADFNYVGNKAHY